MSDTNTTQTQQTEQQTEAKAQPPVIDYDKIAEVVAGKQQLAEDKVLKSFFEKQGLSAEEMNQAISAYKETKAKNSPETINAALKTQLDTATADLLRERVSHACEKAARKLGADEGSIDYIVRLADTSAAVANGEINAEKLTEAVKKVLDDVPAFKKQSTVGGVKIGGDNKSEEKEDASARLRAAFGLK